MRHEWREDALYINPDDIARDQFNGWNAPDANLKAARLAERMREDALSRKASLIFETVFSAPDKPDYLRRTMAAGYFVRAFFIGTASPEINAARVARRVLNGGHDVPIPKIIARYGKSIAQFAAIAAELDRVYVYDNSAEQMDPLLLFRGSNGVCSRIYKPVPEWARPISAALQPAVGITLRG